MLATDSMSARVPTTREVVPGAAVNIVLKADQRTGRTVSGTVKDVLTSGNHPRGIKVRLSDGRVGRVQTMAQGGGSAQGGSVETEVTQMPYASSSGHRSLQRTNEWQAPPQEQLGLDAYMKEAKPKKRGRGNGRQAEGSNANASEESHTTTDAQLATSGEVSTCPVCGDFEGDEAAVSHHVAGHFDA